MAKSGSFPWAYACAAGVVSGVGLGLFLKGAQVLTSYEVYTLLLNVDYIPVLNRVQLPELIEFMLHVLISILVSILMLGLMGSKPWRPNTKVYMVIAAGLLIGILLYPTTLLSERTPDLMSMPAFLWWLLGHGLYGWLLGLLLCAK